MPPNQQQVDDYKRRLKRLQDLRTGNSYRSTPTTAAPPLPSWGSSRRTTPSRGAPAPPRRGGLASPRLGGGGMAMPTWGKSDPTGRKGVDSGGGFLSRVGRNLQGGARAISSIPVGMAALGVDAAKTAIDVPTELGQHVANLGGLAPWQAPDIFDPGNRRALGGIPASIGQTGGRLLELNDIAARGLERTQMPTAQESAARQQSVNRRRGQINLPARFEGGLGDTQYARAWREGQIAPILIEDVGNAALVAGGTGAALQGVGRVGAAAARIPVRGGLRAGSPSARLAAAQQARITTPGVGYGQVATPGMTMPVPGRLTSAIDTTASRIGRAGDDIRNTTFTGMRDARAARAERRAQAMESIIGTGENLARAGNRLDRASFAPVAAPARLAARGVQRGYKSLLDSAKRPGVVENPRAAGFIPRTARYAAQSIEQSGPMRYLAERSDRLDRGQTSAYINMRNIITGGDNTPEMRRAADDGMAAYILHRTGLDPETANPGLDAELAAVRREVATETLAARRRGEQVDLDQLSTLNKNLQSSARRISELVGGRVSPAALKMAAAWRRGDDAETLARFDDAYQAVERFHAEQLESADTPYIDPDLPAVEQELLDQGIDLDSVAPDVLEDLLRDKKVQRGEERREMYRRMRVPEPNPDLRLLDNSQKLSEASRGDQIMPPRYNELLLNTLTDESRLLGPFEEQQRLLTRRDRYAQSLAKADPVLAKATRDVNAGRRFLEETRAQHGPDSPAARAAESELTMRQQIYQDAVSRDRLAPQLVTPGGRLLAGATNRRKFSERLLKMYEDAGTATSTLTRDLQQMTDRFDEVARTATVAPDRYRPAMMHAQNVAKDLTGAADQLTEMGLGPSADLLRQEAQGMPVYVADLINQLGEEGIDIKYVPGGRVSAPTGGNTARRIAGLRFRDTGQIDMTVAGQAALSSVRVAEIARREAENWLAHSQHAVTIPEVLGVDPDAIRLRSADQIVEMRARGYELARKSDAADLDESTPFVPAAFHRGFNAYFAHRSDDTFGGQVRRGEEWAMQKWKRGVLGLSPRWLTGNIVGNLLQAKVQGGVNFRAMPRLWRDSIALHYKMRGLTTDNLSTTQNLLVGSKRAQALDGMLEQWAQDGRLEGLAAVYSHELRVNPELGTYNLNRLMQNARNEALSKPNATTSQVNNAVQDAVRRHLMDQFDGSADSWSRHPLRKLIDESFKLNTFVDDTVRGMVFLDQANKRGGPQNLSPVQAEQAVEASLRMIGNFSSMTAFERTYVRMMFPFWSWMRHITTAATRLPVNHPLRTAWYLHLATVGVPDDYYDGALITTGAYPLGPDKGGLEGDRYAQLDWLNPWSGSVVASLWDTTQNNPVSMALATVANNITPSVEYPYELATGNTIQASAPGQFTRPLWQNQSSLPFDELGFQATSQGLLSQAASGDVTPLLWRTAQYNPVSRLARDTYAATGVGGGGARRTETGEIALRGGEPYPSGDTLLSPASRWAGNPLPPGALLFNTELDQERRVEAERAAERRAREQARR